MLRFNVARSGRPRRPRMTGRAAVLGLVLCAVVAALAYPTRQFVAQRQQISQQRAAADLAKRQLEAERRQLARWQDPAFVAAQARERLHYAFPGETPFVAVVPGSSGSSAGAGSSGTSYQAAAPGQPWYANLWDSLDAADAAPTASPTAPGTTAR
ncbi:FtsB family cell division protein [Phaeacidiphilus oryzae]|uniref:FtsB family cell division protein n=1 Tax=Phaeacidiphilus oryzae TaxID=348818 RepID=UPI00068F9C43|nr:septum formation initiator family protein [Phaeacidiphilus oryzae]